MCERNSNVYIIRPGVIIMFLRPDAQPAVRHRHTLASLSPCRPSFLRERKRYKHKPENHSCLHVSSIRSSGPHSMTPVGQPRHKEKDLHGCLSPITYATSIKTFPQLSSLMFIPVPSSPFLLHAMTTR